MCDKKKETVTEEIENTLACSAFAEEGIPCPIGGKDKTEAGQDEGCDAVQEVENTFACTAFHEENEACPICKPGK